MRGRHSDGGGYTPSQESFLFTQLFVASVAVLVLTAAKIASLPAYLLVLYVLSAIVAELSFSADATRPWQGRIWRVIQAAGVVVGLLLAIEIVRLVRASGVVG